MNQAFSKIWIPIVLLVLTAAGVFAWQYFGAPEKKVPEEVVKEETADWRTYRNEEFGFEVKYPPSGGWEVTEIKGRISLLSKEYRNFLDECGKRGEPSAYCQYGIYILEERNPTADFIVGDYKPLTSIGAKKLRQATHIPTLRIAIPSNKKKDISVVFYLYSRYGEDGKSIGDDKEIFENILSTFRFIE